MAASTLATTRAVRKRPGPKAKAATTRAAVVQGAAVAPTTRPVIAHDQPSTTVGVRELRQNL